MRDAERDPTAHFDLARALLAAERYEEALAAFGRATRLAPKATGPRHGAGLTLLHLGRLEDATRELAEAARLAPRDADIRFDLGGALQRLGRREDAFAEFGAAARVQPGHAAAWGALGLTAAQLGQRREAVAFWERARLLDSTYFAGRGEEAALWKALLTAVGPQPPADIPSLPHPRRDELMTNSRTMPTTEPNDRPATAANEIEQGNGRFNWRRYASEALGTFALVAVGPGAAMVAASTHTFGHTGVALAFGLVVAFVVASTGHLGGAHINPSVTLAFWSVRRFPSRDVIPYIVAQCMGAVAASFALRWILGPVGQLGATIPALSLGRAFAVEFGYSALLAFVIMGVATDERSPAGVAPFALGATVFAGALVTRPLTGGSFNPARSLGPALAGGGWSAHWLYWLAPTLGMVVAMRLYEALRPASAPAGVPSGVPMGVEGPIA